MAVVEGVVSQDVNYATLPTHLLEIIFGLLSSHERRVTVPLVCKAWCEAVAPSKATASLWEEVDIRDLQCRSLTLHKKSTTLFKSTSTDCQAISRWLSKRCDFLSRLTVFPSKVVEACTPTLSVASWSRPFGEALSALTSSSKLVQLVLCGPGVQSIATNGTSTRPTCADQYEANAAGAGAILRGAFSLPSLHQLHVYDMPWVASLHFVAVAAVPGAGIFALPSHINLLNLRELVINRSFYQGVDATSDHALLDGAGAEAWVALGAALQTMPHLERLDLTYTHAITYCDPARGVVAVPWPPLRKLRELSLAHDLSVQPLPPPPLPPSQASMALAAAQVFFVPAGPCGSSSAGLQATSSVAASAGAGTSTDVGAVPVLDAMVANTANGAVPFKVPAGGAATSSAHASTTAATGSINHYYHNSDGNYDGEFIKAGLAAAEELEEEESAPLRAGIDVDAEAFFEMPMLTVDATFAFVELHSWLPSCAALTAVDLRNCGLQGVPLAVSHLPLLRRLDLYGNPLISMRLPGPLCSLTWLRFSLDPCYDMLYDMMAAEAGEETATEEMWTVELPAPQLEDLEVDSSSLRALKLIREVAASLHQLHHLVLVDKSADALL